MNIRICIVYFTIAIAILKKHYYDVLWSLPSDHMISLGRLCRVATITDTTVDRIISCSSPKESNREIIDTLIHMTDSDSGLVKFCDALEGIMGGSSDVIESLRSGQYNQSYMCLSCTYIKYLCSYCNYMHMYSVMYIHMRMYNKYIDAV